MKKIRLDYPPKGISIVMAIILFFLYFPVVLALSRKSELSDEERRVLGILGCIALGVTILFFAAIYFVQIVVVYGSGDIIRCWWLFIMWEIDISQASYFVYTVEPHHTQFGTVYTFNVEFEIEGIYGGERNRIRTKLEPDKLEDCMQGNVDNIKLMRVYRYAEKCYPEKAKGYKKMYG